MCVCVYVYVYVCMYMMYAYVYVYMYVYVYEDYCEILCHFESAGWGMIHSELENGQE